MSKASERIVVTVVEVEGERYHLETLLHEALDRAYMIGMLAETSFNKHPYFMLEGNEEKAKETLGAIWNLYMFLKSEEGELIEANNKDSRLWTVEVGVEKVGGENE